MDDDANQGAFLGGIGGEGGGGAVLPAGVAFRLRKGNAILLNTHFLNTSDHAFDGHTVVDFKFAEVDGKRTIASMFVNGNMSFRVPAMGKAEAVAECKVPRTLQFLMFANHMHDYGTWAITEIVRADGRVELVKEDARWSYEMQFKPAYRSWTLTAPLTLTAGDIVRTRCRWDNTTAAELTFPREMCIGTGFFLSDGSSAPVCMNGRWIER